MKKSELRYIIREEIQKYLRETLNKDKNKLLSDFRFANKKLLTMLSDFEKKYGR